MHSCAVCEKMKADEQYARGWIKLYEAVNPKEAIEFGQYALDLQKLRLGHEERNDLQA